MATLTLHSVDPVAAAADQCLVIAAHRGERFMPNHPEPDLIDWLRAHWPQLVPATRIILVRDTIEALHRGQYPARRPWLEFARWGFFGLDTDEQSIIQRQFNMAGIPQALGPILYMHPAEGD